METFRPTSNMFCFIFIQLLHTCQGKHLNVHVRLQYSHLDIFDPESSVQDKHVFTRQHLRRNSLRRNERFPDKNTNTHNISIAHLFLTLSLSLSHTHTRTHTRARTHRVIKFQPSFIDFTLT